MDAEVSTKIGVEYEKLAVFSSWLSAAVLDGFEEWRNQIGWLKSHSNCKWHARNIDKVSQTGPKIVNKVHETLFGGKLTWTNDKRQLV